jgi:hypothetical protein
MTSFPNVPVAPGVPPVPRASATGIANAITLLAADVALLFAQSPVWGIFDQSNTLIIQPDSIVGFDYRNDYRVTDAPQESGGFQSYNKVANPFDCRIVMTKGGSTQNKADFLASVDAVMGSTDLYHVVTPEKPFLNMTLVHNDFRRTAREGLGLLTVEIGLREVRIAGPAVFTNTQSPNGQDAQNTGQVQPTPATAAQSAVIPSVQ